MERKAILTDGGDVIKIVGSQFKSLLKLDFTLDTFLNIRGNMFNTLADIYLFKTRNGNTKTKCEVCLKLVTQTSYSFRMARIF